MRLECERRHRFFGAETSLPSGTNLPARGFSAIVATKAMEKLDEELIELDDGTSRLFEPYQDSLAIRALDFVSKVGDSRSSGSWQLA